jgi:peroxiredoxin
MAQASVMLPLGTCAPSFALRDVVSGRVYSLDSFAGKPALLVMFICQHCPYVVHVQDELARIGRDYAESRLGIIAISSNDPQSYPEDAPERLREMAERLAFRFPLCVDDTQEVAKSYRAACTPDFFLFDEQRRLVYRGQLDDSRPGNNRPVTGKDLRAAIDAVLAGQAVDGHQKPSIGCGIKWKPGNAPSYT